MESGIELMARERLEQKEKHGFTDAHDDAYFNADGELEAAALFVLTNGVTPYPTLWDPRWREKLAGKDNIEKLVVAGALLAAEIDRLQRKSSGS